MSRWGNVHRGGSSLRWLAAALATALAAGLLVAGPSAHTTAAAASSAGSRSAGDRLFPSVGNGGYDATHYRIAFVWAKGRITATTTLTAKATRRLTSFSLDLKGLSVTKMEVNAKVAAWKRSKDKLVITPAKALAKGKSFTATVSYHGKPVSITDADGSKEGWIATSDGGTALGEPVGSMAWFPNNNTPRDKATYDIVVTAPKARAVASNGDLVARTTKGKSTTWHWRQQRPMATALAMVSIGSYTVYHSTITLAKGRKLPVWTFVGPGVGKLAAQRKLLPKLIKWSEQRFGAYPQTSAGFVARKLGIGYALETQNRPFFSYPPDSATLVHEVAHQWFGDALSVKQWGDIWLNEGFATLAEWCWANDHGGTRLGPRLTKLLARHPASDKAFWKPAPAKLPNAAALFDDAVYTRGGMTLLALRKTVGAKPFWKIVRGWVAAHKDGNVTTAAFTAYAAKASKKKLGGFFTAWLYTAKRPGTSVTSVAAATDTVPSPGRESGRRH